MNAAEETLVVPRPGPAVFSRRFLALLYAGVAVGVVVFALALLFDPRRAWYSYLANYVFFTILSLGGVFLIALEGVTSSTYSVALRRLPEAFATFLPVAFLGGIALLIGVPHLYPWAAPGFHWVLNSKREYFNIHFFDARTIVILLVWVAFAAWFIRKSVAQDADPPPRIPRAHFGKLPSPRGRMSALFLVVFGYTFTILFVDWIMSLEPNWSTTMWGVYGFAGLFESSLALVLFVTVLMRRRGMFGEAVRLHHYVDMSRMLHAFCIFMVYIGFAQYGLIWYANYTEETSFYHMRIVNGWGWVFVFLLFAKWVLPFTILMNQKVRRKEAVLLSMATLVLVAEWFDIYWMVMPNIHASFYVPNWVELGLFVGFLGLFGLMVTRFLSRHPTVPIGDPKIMNSVAGRYLS